MRTLEDHAGLFVAIVGPSGSGKDTVLRAAVARLKDTTPIMIAQRVITREADPAGETHVPVTEDAFRHSQGAGAFLFFWAAHGLSYAIPVDVLDDLGDGKTVIANLSRTQIANARRALPKVLIVEITAPQDILRHRIAARRREPDAAIEQRLSRTATLDLSQHKADLIIENTGSIDDAAAVLANTIEQHVERTPAEPAC